MPKRRRPPIAVLLIGLAAVGILVFLAKHDLAAGILPVARHSSDLTGYARAVDGDTIDQGTDRIRLSGVDAPEHDQICAKAGTKYACGTGAYLALQQLVSGRQLLCQPSGHDRYGRILAICYRDSGEDIGARMVRQGWAVAYRKYSQRYVLDELVARVRGLGLWAGDFEDPEDWRHKSSTA